MKNLVSIMAGKANHVIHRDKPSNLIPFKGEFPICPLHKAEEYSEIISSTEYLDQCPIWVQDIIVKGERIYTMEDDFREYLKNNNISVESFMRKKSSDKATELIRFLNANSLSLDSLDLK